MVSYVLSQATLLIAALISWSLLDHPAAVVLNGTFVHDPLAALAKTSILLITFGAFCLFTQLSGGSVAFFAGSSTCSACSRCSACWCWSPPTAC